MDRLSCTALVAVFCLGCLAGCGNRDADRNDDLSAVYRTPALISTTPADQAAPRMLHTHGDVAPVALTFESPPLPTLPEQLPLSTQPPRALSEIDESQPVEPATAPMRLPPLPTPPLPEFSPEQPVRLPPLDATEPVVDDAESQSDDLDLELPPNAAATPSLDSDAAETSTPENGPSLSGPELSAPADAFTSHGGWYNAPDEPPREVLPPETSPSPSPALDPSVELDPRLPHRAPEVEPPAIVNERSSCEPVEPAAPMHLPDLAETPVESTPVLDVLAEPAPVRVSEAVGGRALEVAQHGFVLAERGALYSARADFIQTLRLISQALDAAEGDNRHSQALASGLRALREADDFVPRGSRLEADLDVAGFVRAHRTPVLKEDENLESLMPLVALQRYYTYAQQQLATAGGNEPAASLALYGMAKMQMHLSDRDHGQTMGGPKAMALHQAALLIDTNNYMAANELGVLLARYGQWAEARRVLMHGLTVANQPEMWRNLASVHEHLGETDLAARARQAAAQPQLATAPPAAGSMVRWVDPGTFSRAGENDPTLTPVAGPAAEQAAQNATRRRTSQRSWSTTGRN